MWRRLAAAMSNLLGVPSPRTAAVALRAPVQAYLRDTFPDMEASLFERDIDAWTSARDACLSHCGLSHDLSMWLRYAAQLVFLGRVLGTSVCMMHLCSVASHSPGPTAFPQVIWCRTRGSISSAPISSCTSLRSMRSAAPPNRAAMRTV